MTNSDINLEAVSRNIWEQTLLLAKVSSHVRLASSLSSVEIFVALYFGGVLRFNPADRYAKDRDRCVVSKGHGSLALYPILAKLGFFDASEIANLGTKGSVLGVIPDPMIPGYETINGSLGHGAGVGTGIALALKSQRREEKVFVVLGDGELQEGSNWEAFSFASQHRLDNIIFVVDNNAYAMLGRTSQVAGSHEDLCRRLRAFGLNLSEVDGHDVNAVRDTLLNLKNDRSGAPKVLVANTVKGNGVSQLEGNPLSHVTAVSPVTIDSILNGRG